MDTSENYTALHDFNEEIGSSATRPIIKMPNEKLPGMAYSKSTKCYRMATILLTLVCCLSLVMNIMLGTLFHRQSQMKDSGCGCQQDVPKLDAQIQTCEENLVEVQDFYSQLCSKYVILQQRVPDNLKLADSGHLCQACPMNWIQHKKKCFSFNTERKTWSESETTCENLGGTLAILETQEEHDFLHEGARNLTGTWDFHFWIGLSDTVKEGEWQWVDKTPLNTTYWHLTNNEPNNFKADDLEGEDCAVLNSHFKAWSDVPCNFSYKFICQKKAIEVRF
ncbi:C-type lectin domain family 4 member E-like [Polypterus senegalus]|uniref:C-type lectin domain family 4 member E-like n=1 Tax=Polypterus senegalus TaxID=55291 RepID=UPI001963B17F|nr:C-type lectin domain family 4 member E-like [Polypterus senegalus]